MPANYFVTETNGAVVGMDNLGGVGGCMAALDLARAESMEMQNDPRFFSGNVINKRLAAFGKLSIVASLMMGTSMGQLFSLKKNMDFSKMGGPEGPIGWFQFVGFLLEMCVAFMCLISLYTICHQLFYTIRLMTAGPTGFELACMFYLTKSIVMWRHFAIKCLLNGIMLFMVSSGVTLYVKFIKDASGGPGKVIVVNMLNGTSTDEWVAKGSGIKSHLDMTVHTILAYFVLVCFMACACLLCMIRRHHLEAFRDYYETARSTTGSLTQSMLQMSQRNRMASPDT